MDLAAPLQTNRPAKCGHHFVPYITILYHISFWCFLLCRHRELEILVLFTKAILLFANLLYLFYQHSYPFNSVSNISFYFFAWKNYEGNLSSLFEIKLNHDITSSWNQKVLISRQVFSCFNVKLFCDNF